jgi:hypothetical protein
MSDAVDAYGKLVLAFAETSGIVAGQMFGKPCLKINGKAFVAQHLETVVFKLHAPMHTKALSIKGATLWDPSGKGRPMKEWVAVPASESKRFMGFAKAALKYVSSGQ